MKPDDTKLVVRDFPIFGWVIAVIFIGIAIVNFVPSALAAGTAALVIRIILGLVGLLILLFASLLTVTADRSERVLTIQHRSLLKESTRQFLFSQIAAIEMEMSSTRSHSSSSSGPSYRIVVVLKDGEVIPFRSYYSGGSMGKTRMIRQLREFTGIGGSEMGMGLLGTLREATKMAQQEFQKQQEELTGDQDAVHVTDGVSWQVQTVAFGGSPVTRWFSRDYQTPGGFVYVTQMVEGQKMGGGGVLGNLSSWLFKPAMAIYGFGQDDTPEPEPAKVLDLNDPALASFSVFTSAPATAQKLLNPRATAVLADWARRYPLKQIHAGEIFGQLVVMFSPKGVYVASMGTMIPEAVEDMTRLGVEMVRSGANCS